MTNNVSSNIIANITTDDWESGFDLIDLLKGDELSLFNETLLGNLKSTNPDVRNRSALFLKETKDPKSVNKLIDAILNPVDSTNCGTIAYSLDSHNCENHLIDIFKILFYCNFECKMEARVILSEQAFNFCESDLLDIKNIWDNLRADSNLDKTTFDMKDDIQEDVDSFLSYYQENDRV